MHRLTNDEFISYNIKEIDQRGADLTNALMTKCSVENSMFKDTYYEFSFTENYYYGHALYQKDFDEVLVNSDEHRS